MRKTKYLTLRVTEKELEIIRGKAKEDNLSLSEWVLKCLLEDLTKKNKVRPAVYLTKDEVDYRKDKELEIPKVVKRYDSEDVEIVTIHSKGVVVVDGVAHKMPTLPLGFKMKCQATYCQSWNTKKYQRATGDFWLCDTHKP